MGRSSPGVAGWLVAPVVLAAAGFRFWNLSRAGISHWDAGTFTAGPLGIGPYVHRELVFFGAPPLVPQMFRALFALFGPVDAVAHGAIAVFGVATVAALYLAGRRWVGGTAALVGAAALAAMPYHLIFSRQALTDVPFTLFFLLAAWAFTAVRDSGRLLPACLAGLAAGAAILTKYHGPLTLVLPVVWLGFLRFRRAATENGEDAGVPLRRLAPLWLVACVLGALSAAWLAFEIDRKMGLDVYRANRRQWIQEPALYLIPQTARFVARSFSEWIPPLTLAPAALGFLVMLRRRGPGDLLLLAWMALFLAVLPFYRFYPRLLVPLLLPLALATGVGIEALWRRGPLALLVLLALLPGAWSSRGVLALEDRGYEAAARRLREGPADPRPDLLVAQHSILFYLRDAPHPFVCFDEPGAEEILESGSFRFLVGDLRLVHATRFREYLASHEGELRLVATVPNPLPGPTVVNSAGFEGLDALRSTPSPEERATLETIRIWQRTP